jgi:glycosyltransferase involved in cell wall biosynthesis
MASEGKKKPRVLLVNNYSMENAYSLWKQGKSGSHHVWGKVELEERGNIEVKIFQHEKFPFLNRIGNLFKIKHLDQQIRLLFYGKYYDILYAPYSLSNTRFLIILKLMGIYRKPILVTIHQPFMEMNSSNFFLRWVSKKVLFQYDGIIFLSEKLKEHTIKALDINEDSYLAKIDTAQWGPDTRFYNNFSKVEKDSLTYFISAGHTSRDYVTLIEAFRKMDYQLKIFCTPKSKPSINELPPNVTINSTVIPYIELLKFYEESIAILIPLKYPEVQEGCQGMTSLQDVVALGKPTIITENPLINIDAEKEGFGKTVEKGDVQGWVDTVELLVKDKGAFHQMSERSLHVYKKKFNSELFAKKLEKAIFKIWLR